VTYKWREPEYYDTGLREFEQQGFKLGVAGTPAEGLAKTLSSKAFDRFTPEEQAARARGFFAGSFFRWLGAACL
jgi:hypothetical protein